MNTDVMIPVIALVGRPNVGKSTLFNCFTKSRDALVADMPGVTRDRQYGQGCLDEQPYIVVDTGGLVFHEAEAITSSVVQQTQMAIEEADAIIFLVDGRAGLTPNDQAIAHQLRQTNKPVFLVVNKTDGINPDVAQADFFSLGFDLPPKPIAASHNHGVTSLMHEVLALFPRPPVEESEETLEDKRIKIAVVGKPNVGKSTLVNRMLGEDRVLVYDSPGTTRDSIFVPFDRRGTEYTLIDTAGIRRRGKVTELIEKFSIIKSLQAIEQCHVAILVIDAKENITDQDLKLIGHILDAGRALVLAVNKWDGMTEDDKNQVKRELGRRLDFIPYVTIHFISALHGSGVGKLYDSIDEAYHATMTPLSSAKLTRILEQAVAACEPPLVQGRRIKLRFAHPGGVHPPCIIIHGNQTESVPAAYKRYLISTYRQALKLKGTPIQIVFKSGENPFAGKRNPLTTGQVKKRSRMMKFVKKSKR